MEMLEVDVTEKQRGRTTHRVRDAIGGQCYLLYLGNRKTMAELAKWLV